MTMRTCTVILIHPLPLRRSICWPALQHVDVGTKCSLAGEFVAAGRRALGSLATATNKEN
jgi:hypothetical protein